MGTRSPAILETSHRGIQMNTQESGPVNPPGGDLQKIAQPLNPNVYSQLTPTLAKFTLRDKVAVITG